MKKYTLILSIVSFSFLVHASERSQQVQHAPKMKDFQDTVICIISCIKKIEQLEYNYIRLLYIQGLEKVLQALLTRKEMLQKRQLHQEEFQTYQGNLLQDYPWLQLHELEQHEEYVRYKIEQEQKKDFETIYEDFKDKRHEYQTWNSRAYINDCKIYGMAFVNPEYYWENK